MTRRARAGQADHQREPRVRSMAALASLFGISEGQVYTVLILLAVASLLVILGIPPTLRDEQAADPGGHTTAVLAVVAWMVAGCLSFLLGMASRRTTSRRARADRRASTAGPVEGVGGSDR